MTEIVIRGGTVIDGSGAEGIEADVKIRDGRIEARADDVPGLGRGMVSGPTLGLRYRLRLPESSGGHVLDAVDWMYLTPDGTIMNRSQFRKFGITVAELVATMRPVGRAEARGADPILETAAE